MLTRLSIIVSVALILTACQGESTVTGETSQSQKGPVIDSLDADLVRANTQFAMELFSDIVNAEPSSNVFVSPPSVAVALAMTYNGADGTTRQAMAEALAIEGFDLVRLNTAYSDLRQLLQNPDSSIELTIANSLWARQGLPFHEDFLERNHDYYGARVEELNFDAPDAAGTINQWVNDQTHGKIAKIVDDPIDPSLIMFLINAIYFKGTWTAEFDVSLTRERPFARADGNRIQHPLMHSDDTYRHLQGTDFQAVSLPYGSGRMSMYVFLPDRESDLPTLLSQLNVTNWEQWMAAFSELDGNLALPKFKLDYKIGLRDALTRLGMGVAFNSGEANFSKMFPVNASQNVYINDVKHKTFVEVNELGTEAAAVTSVEIGITSFDPDQPQRFSMTVDRPFMFAIRDNQTGLVLFMGAITDPSAEK